MCAAAFLMIWLPRLFWGFWTDEAGTFWMAAEGWRAAIPRTLAWPGQSVLYSVIESFFAAGGFWREPLLRLPSVLAMLIAAWHLKKISELVIGTGAGWPTVMLFLCCPDVVNFGTNARPYAPALAASLASFHYLLAWQRSPERGTLLKYLAAAALTVHLHYLFTFAFIVQAAYLSFCRLRGLRVPLALPVAGGSVLALSMLPLIGALELTARSQDFSFANPPAPVDFIRQCFPPSVLLAGALGGLLLLVSGRSMRWRPSAMRPEAVVAGADVGGFDDRTATRARARC
jgi:mannosyltransferase